MTKLASQKTYWTRQPIALQKKGPPLFPQKEKSVKWNCTFCLRMFSCTSLFQFLIFFNATSCSWVYPPVHSGLQIRKDIPRRVLGGELPIRPKGVSFNFVRRPFFMITSEKHPRSCIPFLCKQRNSTTSRQRGGTLYFSGCTVAKMLVL